MHHGDWWVLSSQGVWIVDIRKVEKHFMSRNMLKPPRVTGLVIYFITILPHLTCSIPIRDGLQTLDCCVFEVR